MNLTRKEYEKIKRSVHFNRFMKLMEDGFFTTGHLLAIHKLINDIKGYGSLKNAKVAGDVIETIIASINFELQVDNELIVFAD